MARENLNQNIIRKLWSSGIVHPESKRILSYIRRNRYTPFDTLDVNQLRKDTIEFGQSAPGAILTQIARYSNILNQSTGLSNQGFIPAFTYRITGSMSLLYYHTKYVSFQILHNNRKRALKTNRDAYDYENIP